MATQSNISIVAGFKVLIIVMLFYSFGITVLTRTMPTDAIDYMTVFSNDDSTSFETVSTEIEQGLVRQTNIPVLDTAALVFYSGNILIDLLLNFIYALPQMIGFFVSGLTILFNLDPNLFIILESFAFVTMTAIYMIGIIQLLAGIRSGQII